MRITGGLWISLINRGSGRVLFQKSSNDPYSRTMELEMRAAAVTP